MSIMRQTTEPADALQVLLEHRPDDRVLTTHWPEASRQVVLDRVRAQSGRPVAAGIPWSGASRRFVARVAAAGVLAVALVGTISTLAPREVLPQAGALQRLAVTAGASASPVLAVGEYRHVRFTTRQVAGTAAGGMSIPTESTVTESWFAPDWSGWHRVTPTTGLTRLLRTCAADQQDPTRHGSAAYVAALPTDPDAMLREIRRRLAADYGPAEVGKPSLDERVFPELAHLLQPGQADPRVRAVAITALSRLPLVSAIERTVEGAQVLDVEVAASYGRQQMRFDVATATLMRTHWVAPDVDLTMEYDAEDRTPTMPAEVMDAPLVCDASTVSESAATTTGAPSIPGSTATTALPPR